MMIEGGINSPSVPAPASDPDFGVRILAKDFGGDLVSVPYRGDGPVVQDLIAGQIPAGIGSVGAMLPYAKTGKVRLIAVAAPQRLAAVPELATYEEQGLKGYAVSGFVAMMAPVGTPQDLLQRYDQAIAQVVRSPGFVAKVAELGVVATPGAPAEPAARLRETTAAFASIVKRAGFQIP